MQMDSKDLFFTESSRNKNYNFSFRAKEILHSEQSQYQKIEVFDTYSVGKLLVLDGKTMVSELDEFVYHEVMAHIPSMCAPQNKRVLVIGGGDGGVIRELIKYPQYEQIDLVEIDERVIEVSKIFFPQCTSGLTDPRVNVLATDGIEFVKNKTNFYDVIVVDSTDPEEFAKGLFTKDFYESVKNALTEKGIMVAQCENAFLDEFDIRSIFTNIKNSFPIVESFTAPITIYPGIFWSFAFASKNPIGPHGTSIDENKVSLMQKIEKDLKWYNMNWHKNAAFALPNFYIRKLGLNNTAH